MNFYLLFKSLHLIAIISWMAGLLYLPRIFVYHSESNEESQKKVFKIMEKKLYNYIMMPAMLASWLFGVLLIVIGIQFFSLGLIGEMISNSNQDKETRIKKIYKA